MAGPRQATAVVVANGRKHLTKAETERRLAAEAAARGPEGESAGKFHAPDWLPQQLRGEYNTLRAELVRRKLMEKLDRDILGFYLVAREEYVSAGKRSSAAISRGDVDGARDWSSIQERYFKQARACANDMGLTVTSRCRLVLPEAPPDEDDNDFLRLIQGGLERRA